MSFKAGNKDSPANLGKSPHESTAWFHIVGPCTFCKKSPYDWPFTPPKNTRQSDNLICNVLDILVHWFYEISNIPKKTPCSKKVQFLKIFSHLRWGESPARNSEKRLPNQRRPLWWGKPTIAPSHFLEVWVYQAKEWAQVGSLGNFFFESGQFLTETIGNIGLKLNTAPFFFQMV